MTQQEVCSPPQQRMFQTIHWDTSTEINIVLNEDKDWHQMC